jgi:hypothetical protein
LLNYQGRLTDSSGKPLDGSYNLTFRIYDAETAGNLLWQGTYSNALINRGTFNVLLGDVSDTGFNFATLAFDKPYWLEIKVGNEVMNPRQRIASAGYAIKAEKADVAETISNVLPVSLGGTGTSAAINTPGGTCILDAKGYVPDNSVDTTALKTATAELSGVMSDPSPPASYYILAGGSYSFYPQTKTDNARGSLHISIGTWGGDNASCPATTYTSLIYIASYGGSGKWYVQNRYITSSGEDYWLWALVDKRTKNILSMAGAPDHPAYGNGGDFMKISHPFANFNPATQEVILVDQGTCKLIRQEAKAKGKSVLEIAENGYKVDYSREMSYTPLHSGRYIDDNEKQVKEMVTSIPSYIKVRRLSRLNN